MSEKYTPRHASGQPRRRETRQDPPAYFEHPGGEDAPTQERHTPDGHPVRHHHRHARPNPVPCILVTVALVVLEVVFGRLLFITRLIPARLIVLAIVAMVLITAILAVLMWDARKTRRFLVGLILAVVYAGVLVYGSVALTRAQGTIDNISANKVERTRIGVYVTDDDPAQNLVDAKNYTFGIADDMDRDSTDQAMEKVAADLGITIDPVVMEDAHSLVDALEAGEVDAIFLNSAYLKIMADMEGYEDIESRIRELGSATVETIIDTGKDAVSAEEALENQVFTMYISGIDARTDELISKSNSDVNIIAVINTSTRQILLVTTPRDYFVPLSISNGKLDKLTHAGVYGVQCSMDTLEMLYDIDLDYYFRINFSGFEKIVDALGGVTVYSKYDFTPRHGTQHIHEGYNDLNGAEALAFARERYALPDGDNDRGKNQLELIRAIVDKATSPSILANYSAVLDEVENNFETSAPYDLIAELVRMQLADGGDWDVVKYAVSGYPGNEVPYSLKIKVYVTYPDYDTVEEAKGLIQGVLNGEIVTSPQDEELSPEE